MFEVFQIRKRIFSNFDFKFELLEFFFDFISIFFFQFVYRLGYLS